MAADLRLADVIDLEWLLFRDEERAGASGLQELRRRDREIGARLLEERELDSATARRDLDRPEQRRALALGWLEALRRSAPEDLPGARIEGGLRLAGALLATFGILLGVGTARVVLAYDGREPVNVFYFVAVFFVLQIVLLALTLALLGLQRVLRQSAMITATQAFLIRLSRARFVDRLLGRLPGDRGRVLAVLRSRQSRYAAVERWLAFAFVQRFGVFFNLAALGTCLYLVTFTDLAFGWSTTLDLTASELHRWVELLALPWAALVPEAVPSEEVVAASQWVRLTGAYSGGEGLDQAVTLARRWWMFLVAGLVTWGLLPRLAAFLVGSLRWRRELRQVKLDHAGYQRLFDRMLPGVLEVEATPPEVVGLRERPPKRRAAAATAAEVHGLEGPPALIVWGRLAALRKELAEVVAGRIGREPAPVACAGGADLAGDQKAIAAVAGSPATGVLVLFEAGVQPTKDIISFLRELKEGLGLARPVGIGLVAQAGPRRFGDADEEELAQWRTRLEAEPELNVRLERLGATT